MVRITAPMSYGPLTRTLILRTNDRMNPAWKVTITGEPDTSMIVNPSSIDLGYVKTGAEFRDASMIRTAKSEQIPQTIVTSSRYVSASLRSENNDTIAVTKVDIRIAPDAPRGELKEYLYLKTGAAKQPNVIIPVSAVVEWGLRARPAQAFFGVVSGTNVVMRYIRLEVLEDGWAQPRLGSVGCEALESELAEVAPGVLELRVSLNPLRMPKTLKEYITLHSQTGDVFQIPVIAVRDDGR